MYALHRMVRTRMEREYFRPEGLGVGTREGKWGSYIIGRCCEMVRLIMSLRGDIYYQF